MTTQAGLALQPLVREVGLVVSEGTPVQDVIKQLVSLVKTKNDDIDRIVRSYSELDNQVRAERRKNLPSIMQGSTPEEHQLLSELLFAEQRMINAALECEVIIQSFSSEKVVEFKLAKDNLFKRRQMLTDKYPNSKL